MTRTQTRTETTAGERLVCALSALLLASLAGCALAPAGSGDTGLRLRVEQPVPFPAGSAHATFQRGRVVRQASLFEPYCQLEVNTVAQRRRTLGPGRYRVTRITSRVLRDPVTRIPLLRPALDCHDGIFQESIWRLAPDDDPGAYGEIRHLRCIAPYYNCTFGPPLALDQVQQVVGPYLAVVRLATAAAADSAQSCAARAVATDPPSKPISRCLDSARDHSESACWCRPDSRRGVPRRRLLRAAARRRARRARSRG